MNTPIYSYLLLIPYQSWTAAYFFSHLLLPRKKLNISQKSIFLISFIFMSIIAIIRTYSVTIATNLVQIFVVLLAIFFFEDTLLKKISIYVIYELSCILIEAIGANLFLMIRHFLALPQVSMSEFYRFSNFIDISGITIIIVTTGIIIIRKEVAILEKHFVYMNFKIFIQLIFPLLVPALAQGLIIHQTKNPNFLFLAFIYWLLCLTCYPLFHFGVRSLREQGKKRHFQEQQLLIMKEQLAFSKQSEEEYAALRKWNHDSENHLLAMSYLMDMGKYDQIIDYKEKISI